MDKEQTKNGTAIMTSSNHNEDSTYHNQGASVSINAHSQSSAATFSSAKPASISSPVPTASPYVIHSVPHQAAGITKHPARVSTGPMGFALHPHHNHGKNPRAAPPKCVSSSEAVSTLVSSTKMPGSNNQKKPSVRKKKTSRRKFSQIKRTDTSTSKPNDTLTIADPQPNRIVNPLVDIPPVECLEVQYAAEIYSWSEVVYGRPDTYPLSYYARLLGFQVPPAPPDKYVTLDPSTIPLSRDIPIIPPRGFVTWDDENVLDYKDPVYEALTKETSNVVDSLKRANLNVTSRFLKQECLTLAKEILGDDLPNFVLDDKGDFGIKASDGTCIRYQFQWYQFKSGEGGREEAVKIGPYGVTSLASHIKKPQVSELTLHISWLGKGDPTPKKPLVREPSSVTDASISLKHASVSDLQSGPAETLSVTSTSLQQETRKSSNGGKERNEENQDSPERRQTDDINVSDNRVLIVLTALALEHARACDILYGIAQVPEAAAALLTKYFRMTPFQGKNNFCDHHTLLCDLKSNSSKHTFLLYKGPKEQRRVKQSDYTCDLRMLVRLPCVDWVKRGINGVEKSTKSHRLVQSINNTRVGSAALRSLGFSLRLETTSDDLRAFKEDSAAEIEVKDLDTTPSWDLLRSFPRKSDDTQHPEDEVLLNLNRKRDQLIEMERDMEPYLRIMLGKVIEDRLRYENYAQQRKEEQELLNGYQDILDRRRELDMAFQKQRDQDMDAVCEICNDGEVTPDNQILFCEACNVAIHQFCYGIERVPQGDYYCIACRFFGREKMNLVVARQNERGAQLKIAPTPLPINCELCPQRQGAFIRTDTSSRSISSDEPSISKWVHMLCAKWQGLNFVDSEKKDCVEDVFELKQNFRVHDIKCHLCKGDRGAFNQCRAPACDKWLHITCARSFGECEVIHGENCHGGVLHFPWTLMCPEHSDLEKPPGSVSLEHLQMLARGFPPEPKVERIKPKATKAFGKMNGNERREFLSDLKNEQSLVTELLTKKLHGVRCEVCFSVEEEGKNLTKCISCAVVFCDCCKLPYDTDGQDVKQFKCPACLFVEDAKTKQESVESPRCVLCFQKGGWLRKARGAPMKKWQKSRQKEFEKTMFGKLLWSHALCSLWHFPSVYLDESKKEVNLSNVIMTHGRGFVLKGSRCEVCGQDDGLKVRCSYPSCRQRGQLGRASTAHVTCARQIGFQVDNRLSERPDQDTDFFMHCYLHSGCEYAFRARLEDLIELEKIRVGKRLDNQDSKPMSLNHASRLLNAAIVVGQYLGWAWRWAEWWVEYGSTWEPLIEPGQDEKSMTKEQLKIVDSTKESRCHDARRCRLAAFGAALRNRSYDVEEDGPTVMFDRALRAILNTESLVGPLTQHEIDFFCQWLGIAYRSKSRLLGYGDDAIVVDQSSSCCLHEEDKSPKFALGSRRLPGKQILPEGQIFEDDINEVDDFLKPERLDDGTLYSEVEKTKKDKQIKRKSFAPAKTAKPPKKSEDDDYEGSVFEQTLTSSGRSPSLAKVQNGISDCTFDKAANPSAAPSNANIHEPVMESSPKRQRKPTVKGSHYWGLSGEDSALASSNDEGNVGLEAKFSGGHALVGDTNAKKVRRQGAVFVQTGPAEDAGEVDNRILDLGMQRDRSPRCAFDRESEDDGGGRESTGRFVRRKRVELNASLGKEIEARRPRRSAGPSTYIEESLVGSSPIDSDFKSNKLSSAIPRKTKGSPGGAGKELHEEGRRSGRRRTAQVSYSEYDSDESEGAEKAYDVSHKATRTRSKAPTTSEKGTTNETNPYLDEPVPRKNPKRKRSSELDDTQDIMVDPTPSFSSFLIPRKAKTPGDKAHTDTESKAFLSLEEKSQTARRGRLQSKLETSQTSLL